MSQGVQVPKLSKEYVADEILRVIREEPIDPLIGDAAKEIHEQLLNAPVAVEKALGQIRAEPGPDLTGASR
jgi:hypothetical protein